jgi:hypothetical protein
MASRSNPRIPPGTREIDEQTQVGEVFMRSLLRSQLRHALSVLAVTLAVLASLPALFAVIPALSTMRVLTVPLPWVVLGMLVYPLLFGASWWYVRAAERTERDFADLVEPPDDVAGTAGRG